jgi:23S rRNA pseudouridine2604 synthase
MAHANNDSTNLNKYISNSGYCSRREADRLIEQGRITINAKTAELGNRVVAGDKVYIDGELINMGDKRTYIAFNKPIGVISTTDREIKDNIIDYLNFPKRIFPIGRLDKASEGLIFLTSDGDIVNKILRAGNNHEKEYIVTVDKPITPEFIFKMGNGIPVLDTITNNCKVKAEGKQTFRITLTQGLNRQIRRMCEFLDYKVVRLKRVRIMNISIGNLPIGQWRYLTAPELDIINLMISDSTNDESASVSEVIKQSKKPLDKKKTVFKQKIDTGNIFKKTGDVSFAKDSAGKRTRSLKTNSKFAGNSKKANAKSIDASKSVKRRNSR